LYALIAPSFVRGASNVAFIVGLLVLVPLAVVGRHRLVRRLAPVHGLPMDPSAKSSRAKQFELEKAAAEGFDPWWDIASSQTRMV
jgi:hypothetical protein